MQDCQNISYFFSIIIVSFFLPSAACGFLIGAVQNSISNRGDAMIKYFSLLLVLISINTFAQTQTVSRQTVMMNGAEVTKLSFNLQNASVRAVAGGQSEMFVPGAPMMTYPGAPKLPFYSLVVAGDIRNISVQYALGTPQEYKVGRLAPTPYEKLRCGGFPIPTVDRVAAYAQYQAPYRIDYIGDFRGTPINRVTVFPHAYDIQNGKLSLYPKAQYVVQVRNGTTDYNRAYRMARSRGSYDYLIITPPEFKDALQPWMDFKSKTQQMRFKVV